MGDRIAFEAVSPALQEQEFGLESPEVRGHLGPNFGKRAVARTGMQRQIELGAGGRTTPRLLHRAGAGIQIAPVLVYVGNDDFGVVFKGVVHPIAVMSIDIHISDAPKSGTAAQKLNCNSAIVENAETRCMIAAGVVQACNRHKRPAAAAN